MRQERIIPAATLWLCGILVVIFLVDYLALSFVENRFALGRLFGGDEGGLLTQWLSLNTKDVLNGQVWRIFTSMFLHGGLVHLLFNLATLICLGKLIEPVVGKRHFLFVYLGSGVISALCMLVFMQIRYGLGASTAISGLLGFAVILAIAHKKQFLRRIRVWQWIVLGVMVLSNLLFEKLVLVEHLTGFAGGLLLSAISVFVLCAACEFEKEQESAV